MTPGKLISIIAVLILLALAAEGGYYWGFNRGLKNAPAAPTLTQTPTSTPTALFSAKDPADVQSTLEALTLLFKPQVINHLKNVPAGAVWWSSWSIAIGGKLTSLSDKQISLELNPDQKVRSWTLPALIHYQVYNETTRQTSDIPKETIQSGETVNFSVSFDTKSGEAKEAWITKTVK